MILTTAARVGATLWVALLTQVAAPPAIESSRADAFALIQKLNADLLDSRSATATIEMWCRDRHLATEPRIVAEVMTGIDKPVTADHRRHLQVSESEPVKYRRVRLRCGSQVLSEADNWYVPSRLTPDMNRQLDTTSIPFGRAVAALEPYRRTVDVRFLWRPEDGELIPEAVLEHRAILYTRDRRPFSEVVEVYQRVIVDRNR